MDQGILEELVNYQILEIKSKVFGGECDLKKVYEDPLLFDSQRMLSKDEAIKMELKISYFKIGEKE